MEHETDAVTVAWASSVVADASVHEAISQLGQAGLGPHATQFAVVEPVTSTFPEQPLDTAVHNLVLATRAAGRACVAAARLGDARCADLAAAAAQLSAEALTFAVAVTTQPVLRSHPGERDRLAHTLALLAFRAGELLDGWPTAGSRGRPPQFPASWSQLLHVLKASTDLATASVPDGAGESSIRAAAAANDGARAARRAYERFSCGSASSAAACRFARLAALAATYGGCAALLPLRDPSLALR